MSLPVYHQSYREKNTPFSCSNPSSDEHPGPPGYESGAQFVLVNWIDSYHLSLRAHIRTSSAKIWDPRQLTRKWFRPCFLEDQVGRTKRIAEFPELHFNSSPRPKPRMIRTLRVSPRLLLIGNNPAQLGPISKSTSGIFDPFTQKSTKNTLLV